MASPVGQVVACDLEDKGVKTVRNPPSLAAQWLVTACGRAPLAGTGGAILEGVPFTGTRRERRD